MKSLILTGPESTGKTTIAQHVSKELKIDFIPEFSRAYLTSTNGHYEYSDLAKMAREAQAGIGMNTATKLILDTDILTYKIWSEVKYQRTDPWIEANLKINKHSLYLLCYPDIAWSDDPLRENPHDRLVLFTKYEDLLRTLELDYFIICGKNSRLLKALEIATNYFNF